MIKQQWQRHVMSKSHSWKFITFSDSSEQEKRAKRSEVKQRSTQTVFISPRIYSHVIKLCVCIATILTIHDRLAENLAVLLFCFVLFRFHFYRQQFCFVLLSWNVIDVKSNAVRFIFECLITINFARGIFAHVNGCVRVMHRYFQPDLIISSERSRYQRN